MAAEIHLAPTRAPPVGASAPTSSKVACVASFLSSWPPLSNERQTGSSGRRMNQHDICRNSRKREDETQGGVHCGAPHSQRGRAAPTGNLILGAVLFAPPTDVHGHHHGGSKSSRILLMQFGPTPQANWTGNEAAPARNLRQLEAISLCCGHRICFAGLEGAD